MKIRATLLTSLLVSLPMFVSAQPTLSGTVTDQQGAGLENAVVELKSAARRVLTDGSGEFNFSASQTLQRRARVSRRNVRFAIRNNRLLIQTFASTTPVCIELYSLTGELTARLTRGLFGPGLHSVTLPRTLPDGCHVLRIRAGGVVSTLRLLMASGELVSSIMEAGRDKSAGDMTDAMAKRHAVSDTLVISKYGYHTRTQVIPDVSATGIVVALSAMPPDSIVPPGMKSIPGGTFIMGSEHGDPGEMPIHEVTLSPFFADSTEVTQIDYATLMHVEPWLGYEGFYPGGVGPFRPVWYITWCDAVLYCNERSKRDGLDTVYSYSAITGTPGDGCSLSDVEIHYDRHGYRLPTEAEWEYAARAGTTTEYYWGDDNTFSVVAQYAWFDRNSGGETHPVARKIPNALGLYDIAGNVWEFCNDYETLYDWILEQTENPTGPEAGEFRVLRGGGWYDSVSQLRSARRLSIGPGSRSSNRNSYNVRAVLPVD